MKFGYGLFARFGLFSSFGLFTRKVEAGPDLFEMRLERTRMREARREAQPMLFRTRLSPQEA
jgi:hypothetical protein